MPTEKDQPLGRPPADSSEFWTGFTLGLALGAFIASACILALLL